MGNSRFISLKELAAQTGISPFTLKKLALAGAIPAYRLGSRGFLFNLEEVVGAIREHRV